MRPTALLLAPALLCAALLPCAAQAQQSARDVFEAGLKPGQAADWPRWEYQTHDLAGRVGLDFNLGWGYVEPGRAGGQDVFVVIVRNHTAAAYCVRPKLSFTGELSGLSQESRTLLLEPGSVAPVASMRLARRTEVEYEIDAAYWPARTDTARGRCNTEVPDGLDAWLRDPRLLPFPGNRLAPPPADD